LKGNGETVALTYATTADDLVSFITAAITSRKETTLCVDFEFSGPVQAQAANPETLWKSFRAINVCFGQKTSIVFIKTQTSQEPRKRVSRQLLPYVFIYGSSYDTLLAKLFFECPTIDLQRNGKVSLESYTGFKKEDCAYVEWIPVHPEVDMRLLSYCTRDAYITHQAFLVSMDYAKIQEGLQQQVSQKKETSLQLDLSWNEKFNPALEDSRHEVEEDQQEEEKDTHVVVPVYVNGATMDAFDVQDSFAMVGMSVVKGTLRCQCKSDQCHLMNDYSLKNNVDKTFSA